ncbi:MAG: dipeptidase [Saprospiraceae bacterium]|nr:dipeptidase [Saprospiraceae bacterium]
MQATQSYIEQNKDKFLEELFSILRIPSVSADPKYKTDVAKTADAVAEAMKLVGVNNVTVYPTKGHPIVYGDYVFDSSLPTVLVYGHYDVQPPDPLDLWDTPPFEPTIKKTEIHPNGAIFARGSCDDKGQFFMHLKAFEAMHKNNELYCNVKFMIEGEEEVGSVHLGQFCKENKELLKCDMVMISDTGIISNDTPSITVGLRGLSYVEVEVVGPNRDLHSGVYGGAVPNPAQILCDMLASLKDENKHITIPGFYDDVVNLSSEDRDAMNQAPFNKDEYMKGLGIDATMGESGYTVIEQTSIRPTLEINGIWGGYIGEGAKTVLPSKAYAKISMRLVPNQKSDAITQLFKDYFTSIAPKGVQVKVTPHHGGEAAVTPSNTLEYKAAALAMEKSYGKTPIPVRGGGSIPIVALFESVLEVKTVLMGFGLDSDDIHSPNEHYGVENFFKGIQTIPYFHKYYSQLKQNS